MRIPALLVCLFCLASTGRATTVVPPTFDELIGAAEFVFRGQVTEVRSVWSGDGARKHPATLVTFAVERALRGVGEKTLTLEFVGGEIGDRALVMSGWPQFTVGDRGVFFVENRKARLCPLVRLRHGRYRIVSDAPGATERVVRDDYTPLTTVGGVTAAMSEQADLRRLAAVASALTLEEFERKIVARSAELPVRSAVSR